MTDLTKVEVLPKFEVLVTVCARPLAGKTTVSLIIENALKAAGFEVEFKDTLQVPGLDGEPTQEFIEHSPAVLEKIRAEVLESDSARVKRVSKQTKITIKQVQKKRISCHGT